MNRQATFHNEREKSWPARRKIRDSKPGNACKNYNNLGVLETALNVQGGYKCGICGVGAVVIVPFSGIDGDTKAQAHKALLLERIRGAVKGCTKCQS